MKKKKFEINWLYVLYTVIILLAVASASMCIYCWITYGGKPVKEIPFWALWFMWGK